MLMLINELTPEQAALGLSGYENRETIISKWKAQKEADQNETEALINARDMFIQEAVMNIQLGREELGMADADYCAMIKNAGIEIDCAEKLQRIINEKSRRGETSREHKLEAVAGGVELVSDVICKSPRTGYASKIGGIFRKIFSVKK